MEVKFFFSKFFLFVGWWLVLDEEKWMDGGKFERNKGWKRWNWHRRNHIYRERERES